MKTLKSVVTITILVWTTVSSYCASPSDTNQLAVLIGKNLSQWYPAQNSNIVRLAATQIASECAGATNSAMLYNALTNAFCSRGLANSDASAVAAAIALQTYNPDVPVPAFPSGNAPAPLNLTSLPPFISTNHISIPAGAQNSLFTNISPAVFESQPSNSFAGPLFANPASLMIATNNSSLPYMAFISVGAEFMNPYQIVSNALTSSKSSTAGYVQFDYINRFVTRDPAKILADTDWQGSDFMGGHWVKFWRAWPDIQGQIGFLFANGGSTSSNNYTASTLAGSGDFYAQASTDIPIWRQISVNYKLRQQTFIDCAGGFTADDQFYRLHPNMFFGMGYEAAFVPSFGSDSTNIPGFFVADAGAAWVNTPKFASNSGTEISTNANDGMPVFDWDLHPAVQMYLAWPLTKSIFLTVNANAYFQVNNQQEASWNVKVGTSIPLDKITSTFSSFLN